MASIHYNLEKKYVKEIKKNKKFPFNNYKPDIKVLQPFLHDKYISLFFNVMDLNE